jgi:hypothetical protein
MSALTGYRPGAMAGFHRHQVGANTLRSGMLSLASDIVRNRFSRLHVETNALFCEDREAIYAAISDAYAAARAMVYTGEGLTAIERRIDAMAAALAASRVKRPWWRRW